MSTELLEFSLPPVTLPRETLNFIPARPSSETLSQEQDGSSNPHIHISDPMFNGAPLNLTLPPSPILAVSFAPKPRRNRPCIKRKHPSKGQCFLSLLPVQMNPAINLPFSSHSLGEPSQRTHLPLQKGQLLVQNSNSSKKSRSQVREASRQMAVVWGQGAPSETHARGEV